MQSCANQLWWSDVDLHRTKTAVLALASHQRHSTVFVLSLIFLCITWKMELIVGKGSLMHTK